MECVSVFVRFNETFTHVIEALIECRIDRVCEREDNLQHTLYTYLPLSIPYFTFGSFSQLVT